MSVETSRKPSASTAHSHSRSPSTGGANNTSSRKQPSGPTSNFYGMNGGNAGNGLKALNTGWQVWGATPSSKRNASMSSISSDPNFRTNVGEAWTAPRSASGAWDDSALRKDVTSLRHPRQSPFSGARVDDRASGSKNASLIGGYSNTQPSFPVPALGYDAVAPQSPESDLANSMRVMNMEDEFASVAGRYPVATMSVPIPSASEPRQMYNGYPAQNNAFYRDSFVDYANYGGYNNAVYNGTEPGLYPTVPLSPVYPANGHSSGVDAQGVYFDYNAASRSQSQYFFPAQAMMFPPHSPMLSSQPSSAASLTEKKMEMQQHLQQQLAARNMMFSPSRPYVDYNSQILSAASMQPMFGMRMNRRHDPQLEMGLPRSPLLDEFRASKGRKWSLRDIKGHVVEFSGDQHGSRFIQNELAAASSEEKQSVFDEIVPHNTLQLMQDVFGNYVIQKLFDHGTQAQKSLIASTMEGHLVELSINLYGCRVVQKAVECILPEQQASLVRELEPQIIQVVKDSNGNHVVQKIVERLPSDRLAFVSTFTGHVFELAAHPFGCRVLQRCLQYLSESQTRPLLDELLHSHTTTLMQDQFGNYVIQLILESGLAEDKAVIVSHLRGRLLTMARHKFASNVCEKALTFAEPESRRALINEIMAPPAKPDGLTPVLSLMKDQYGNYVLQRALAVAEGDQKEALVNLVRPQLAGMRRSSAAFSKHLISIERELEKISPSDTAR